MKAVAGWTGFVVVLIVAAPFLAFGELLALGTVNFHDVLEFTAVVSVMHHLWRIRKENRATVRSVRRIATEVRAAVHQLTWIKDFPGAQPRCDAGVETSPVGGVFSHVWEDITR